MQKAAALQHVTIRRPYLDWMRIIVVLMLVPFHTAMTFSPFAWYLRNSQLSTAAQGLVTVLNTYQMPLLFLIAGAAIYFSLGVRSWKDYSVERILRLLIPLIFGMFILVPPCYFVAAKSFQVYYAGSSHFPTFYTGSIWSYYTYFWSHYMLPFNNAFNHTLDAGALWFLWYLIFYTIALSPLFILLRRKVSDGFFNKLSKPFENPLMIFALFIPVALFDMYSSNKIVSWGFTASFPFLYYVIFFIYGFFLFSAPGFEKGLKKAGPWELIVGIIALTFTMLIVFPTWQTSVFGMQFWSRLRGGPGTPGNSIYQAALGLATWGWIVGLIYLAQRFLNFSNKFVRYGNDAVLPYYIVHSTPIALIGYWIIQQPWGVAPKYFLNVVLAFLATVLVYELIRRTNATRFLFGMRLKKATAKQRVTADGRTGKEGATT